MGLQNPARHVHREVSHSRAFAAFDPQGYTWR